MPQHGQQLDPGAPSHFPFQHPGMSSGCWNWMSGGLKRANRPRIIQLEREKKKSKELIPVAPVAAGGRINPKDGRAGCLGECVPEWEDSLQICQRTLHQNN